MIAILEFVFASGWRFAGAVILIIAVAFAVSCFRPLSGVITIEKD